MMIKNNTIVYYQGIDNAISDGSKGLKMDVSLLHDREALKDVLKGTEYVRKLQQARGKGEITTRIHPYTYDGSCTLRETKAKACLSCYVLADFDREKGKTHKLGEERKAETIINDIVNHPSRYPSYIYASRLSKSDNLHVIFRAEEAPSGEEAYRQYYLHMCGEFCESVRRSLNIELETDLHLANPKVGLRVCDRRAETGQNIALSKVICETLNGQAKKIEEERARREREYIDISGTWDNGETYEPTKGENYDATAKIANAIARYSKSEEEAREVARRVFGANFASLGIASKLRSGHRIKNTKNAIYCKWGLQWLIQKHWFHPNWQRENERSIQYGETMYLDNHEYLTDREREIADVWEKHNAIQIVAPMGTGKTTLIRNIVAKAHEKGQTCLIVNFLVVLNRNYDDMGNTIVYQGGGSKLDLSHHDFGARSAVANIANISVLSEMQLQQIDYLIIDEIHKAYTDTTYRNEQCEALCGLIRRMTELNGKVLAVTASPIKDDIFHYIKVDKRASANFFLEWAKGLTAKNWHKYIELMQKDDRQLVFLLNNSARCVRMAEDVQHKLHIKCDYITAKSNTEGKKYLLENEMLRSDIKCFFCTSVINEGINIRNTNNVYYITDIANVKNPLNLTQLGGRSRATARRVICGYSTASEFNIAIQPSTGEMSYTEMTRLRELSQYWHRDMWEKRISEYVGGRERVTISEIDALSDRMREQRDEDMTIRRTKPREEELKEIYAHVERYKKKAIVRHTNRFSIDGVWVEYEDMSMIKRITKCVEDGYPLIASHIGEYVTAYAYFCNARDTKYYRGDKEIETGKAVEEYTRGARRNREKYPRLWAIFETGNRSAKAIERAIAEDCKKKYHVIATDGTKVYFDTKDEALEMSVYELVGVSRKEFKNHFKKIAIKTN